MTVSDMATDYRRRPITADEYERMGEFGIFDRDENIELIDGEIIVMPPMNPPHFGSIARITELFVRRLNAFAIVTPQLPIRISTFSEPQPDFALLRRSDDFYSTRRPTPNDVIAFVECADSSLRYDRGTKLRAYAKADVREYWIVNLSERCIEIHREPHELGYRSRIVAASGDSVAFESLPELTFAVDEFFGSSVD